MNNTKKQTEIEESNIELRFGNTYDHPARNEDAKNNSNQNRNDHLPHRHLMKWYLTKKNDEEPPPPKPKKPTQKLSSLAVAAASKNTNPPLSLKRRYPLPANFKFEDQNNHTHEGDQYLLHGYMIPPSGTNGRNHVPIVSTKLKYWKMDVSYAHRGIWVKTESAWYYLKDPCHVAVPRVTYFEDDKGTNNNTYHAHSSHLAQDPYLPSQESLNLPLRAKMGLMSNILDIFSEKKDGRSHHYAPLHAKISVEESYKILSLNSTLLKTKYQHVNPALNEEPFDIKLLKQKGVAGFVRECLQNYHLTLSDSSMFMKSLLELKNQTNDKVATMNMQQHQQLHQNEWRENDYRESAIKSEKRGRRESWCEPLPNKDEPQPNRLIELEAGNESTDPLMRKKVKEEQKKAVEDTTSMLLGGSTNHVFVMTEKTEFDENIMKESMIHLSNFLLPRPTEDDKSADYVKFAVDHTKMEEFLQTYVMTNGVLSLEAMLLIISAVAQSSDKAMKSLFKVRSAEDSTNTAGAIIFRYWLSYAVSVMEKRRHRFSRTKPKVGEVRTEEVIVAKILELISKYHVIKTSKQINTLKNKYNVDWVDSVQKTYAYANAHDISVIIPACKLAMDRLDEIERERSGGIPSRVRSDSSRSLMSRDGSMRQFSESSLVSTKSQDPKVDAKSLRLAKMIKESNKRILSVQKEDKKISDTSSKPPANLKTNYINKPVKDVEYKVVVNNASTSSSVLKESKKIQESPIDDMENSKKGEDGFKSLPFSSLRDTKRIEDDEKITHREENGLIGLPFYAWKHTNVTTQEMERKQKTEKVEKSVEQQNQRDNYSRSTYPTTVNDSYKRKSEDRDDGSDQKRRKIDGYQKRNEKNEFGNPIVQSSDEGSSGENRRGIGRGKDINKPAWMTRQESKSNIPMSNQTQISQTSGSFSNKDSKSIGRGRGRGRGKDINKPAWMTKQGNKSSLLTGSNSSVTNDLRRNIKDHEHMTSDRMKELGSTDKNMVTSKQTIGNQKNLNKMNSNMSKNTSISHGQVPVREINTTGRGRGRGRGKDINKPAWMTKQQNNLSSNHGSSNEVDTIENGREPRPDVSKGRGRGRGRGKGINKPAWMTKQQNNSIPNHETDVNVTNNTIERHEQNAESSVKRDIGNLGRGKDLNNPVWMTKEQGELSSNYESSRSVVDTIVKDRERNPDINHGRGRGRGRGRDINKPAWMTKQMNNANSNFKPNINTASNNGKDHEQNLDMGRGRGRGRGKDLNRPAWMTRQESSNTVSGSNKPQSNTNMHNISDSNMKGSNQENELGRGRSTDIQQPSWKTKQERRTQFNFSGSNGAALGSVSKVDHAGLGRGRGRGKDINKPAWMTKQENDKMNSSDSQHSIWLPPSSRNSSTNRNNRRY